MDDNVWLKSNELVKYTNDNELIKFVSSKFYRISRYNVKLIIGELIKDVNNINLKELSPDRYKGTVKNNTRIFNENGDMKEEVLKLLKEDFDKFLLEIGKELPYFRDDTQIKKVEGHNHVYQINKFTTYTKVLNLLMREGGNAEFKYDFNNIDLPLSSPKNEDFLQRCNVQVIQEGINFGFPIEYNYHCPKCNTNYVMLSKDVSSTKTRIQCSGKWMDVDGEGNPKAKACTMSLYPSEFSGVNKDAYLYFINYETETEEKKTVEVISFNKFDPGFYECVLFKTPNPKQKDTYQIMDVKMLGDNFFEIPEKVEGENYIFTMQRALDKFLEEQVGVKIYGLFPIKISLMLQKVVSMLGFNKVTNCAIIGDAATGKSTVLKYWLFLLNGQLNLSSSGVSISIAGLRGTQVSVSLLGKETKIVVPGHLNKYISIHIDEAGENRELIQKLKTFLYEQNYSYDKAGGTGISYERRAHVNISENLNHAHAEKYKRTVRKLYRDDSTTIEGEEKEMWDETWDLFQPLGAYDNPYLFKAIQDTRNFFESVKVFWLDGYDIALHDRFPFYFYLVKEKYIAEIREVIRENVHRKNRINDNLEIIKALKASNITKYFKSLKEFKHSESDKEHGDEINKILEEYGVGDDFRHMEFYHRLVVLSRIINKRMEINEEDLHLLRWFIEKTNCKLDVADTASYDVAGPPDIKKMHEKELAIEQKTKKSDTFGLPDDFS